MTLMLAVLMTLVGAVTAAPSTDLVCPFAHMPADAQALIGYVGYERQTGNIQVGPFRALCLLSEREIQPTDGRFIRDGMEFWSVLSPDRDPVALGGVSSFVDRMGADHCVYHGRFRGAAPPLWTLVSSKPLPGVLRRPGDEDRSYFNKYNTTCVDQGDHEVGKQPPCTRPELLAVSDFDGDGSREYWATEPYMWDTGITVWRRTNSGLTVVLSACPGCSD